MKTNLEPVHVNQLSQAGVEEGGEGYTWEMEPEPASNLESHSVLCKDIFILSYRSTIFNMAFRYILGINEDILMGDMQGVRDF